MCDLEAWSHEEVDYYIPTSDVTLCKQPVQLCYFCAAQVLNGNYFSSTGLATNMP